MRQRSYWLTTFAILAALCAAGSAAPRDAEKPGHDLRKLYAEYRALPEAKRRHLLNLDRELDEEELSDRERLLKVMQRYSEWLDKLPADKRAYIESAAHSDEKLKRIRLVREEQWIDTLAKIDRDRIDAAMRIDQLADWNPLRLTLPLAAFALDASPLRTRMIASIRDREHKRDAEFQGVLASVGDGAALIRLQQQAYRQDISEWYALFLKKKLSEEDRKILFDPNGKFNPAHLVAMADLSKKHNIEVPERLQPKIELFREGLPLPPEQRWRQYLYGKANLDDKKWKEYEARLTNPTERDKAEVELIRLFWKDYPKVLKQVKEDAKTKRPPRPGDFGPPRP